MLSATRHKRSSFFGLKTGNNRGRTRGGKERSTYKEGKEGAKKPAVWQRNLPIERGQQSNQTTGNKTLAPLCQNH